MENQNSENTSFGIKENIAALLCYAVGWISGLIFILMEKDNKFVKFHAMQSIVVFGTLTIIEKILPVVFMMFSLITVVNLVSQLVGYAGLALWILLMVKAYQGQRFKLPIAGDIAEQMIK